MLQHAAAAAHFYFGEKHKKKIRKVVISFLLAGLCESFDGEQYSGQPLYFGLDLSLWFQSEWILCTLELLCAAVEVHS